VTGTVIDIATVLPSFIAGIHLGMLDNTVIAAALQPEHTSFFEIDLMFLPIFPSARIVNDMTSLRL
jgi:hypothetical protein